jgi:hypothetical protein
MSVVPMIITRSEPKKRIFSISSQQTINMSLAEIDKKIQASQQERAARNEKDTNRLFSRPPPIDQPELAGAALVSKNTAYILPPKTDNDFRFKFFIYLVTGACKQSPTTASRGRTWILSLLWLFYPEVMQPESGRSTNVAILSDDHIALIDEAWRRWSSIDGSDAVEAKKAAMSVSETCSLPMFPVLGYNDNSVLALERNFEFAYGYLGLVCTTIQKDADKTGWPAISESRPRALIEKYSLSQEAHAYIGGGMKMSKDAAIWMRKEWMVLPQCRRRAFSYFVRIATGNSVVADEVLFTLVRLMMWTDLSHIPIIHKFLKGFEVPSAAPALANSISVYNQYVQQLLSSCPDRIQSDGSTQFDTMGDPVKNTDALPYVKIFVGDKLDVAARRGVEALLQVAGHYLVPHDPALSYYTFPVDHESLVTRVNTFEREFNSYKNRRRALEDATMDKALADVSGNTGN